MMPTARKKMSGMGMFMSRHADGSASGPTSPRQGVTTNAPAQSPPQTTLQPAPQIVVSRQDIAASAKLPVPRGGRFGFTGAIQGQAQQQSPQRQQSLPGSPPAASTHYHPMQRSKTSDQAREAGHTPNLNGGMWEDSTVASMFEETDSRGGSDRFKGQHNRAYSETAYPRQGGQNELQRTHDEHAPFVIGNDGLLKVVGRSGPAVNGPSATTLNTSVQSDINEQAARMEDVYQDDNQYEHTPPRNNTLRRTKLAQRDAREPNRSSFPDNRPAGISSPPESNSAHGSPGRRVERADRLDSKLEEAVRERELREYERARERERELHHKRSTIFENLTPVDDPTWLTQAAVGVPTTGDATTSEDYKEALQRTPRATSSTRQLVSRPASRQPLVAQKPSLREASPDYNDAELNAMSYAELQKQDFDYDPQAAAMQQTSVPSGNSLEDKLTYYKDKDSLDQHHFFTQISIGDWEEAGDWFLDQFSSVVQKLKTARREKREMVAQFEKEINGREEAVRIKMEGIGRTLQELKQEGQNMMSGKDVDV
ncbi:hypothetical protein BR93DRAFT_342450 [Coniochaeta sp. PMI_546]|nr:hypothetical protein BR93DRAFT_342450 [Coniochaeta sp. PMI_546]